MKHANCEVSRFARRTESKRGSFDHPNVCLDDLRGIDPNERSYGWGELERLRGRDTSVSVGRLRREHVVDGVSGERWGNRGSELDNAKESESWFDPRVQAVQFHRGRGFGEGQEKKP
jgi:hypothetical protein